MKRYIEFNQLDVSKNFIEAPWIGIIARTMRLERMVNIDIHFAENFGCKISLFFCAN